MTNDSIYFISRFQVLVIRMLFILVLSSINLVVTAQKNIPSCTIQVSQPGATVADICRGQQVEEFNHQFEGGLYAQLINNPSFEALKDPIAEWSLLTTGKSSGRIVPQTATETAMLNNQQRHCIKLEVCSIGSGHVGLSNRGYWGLGLKNGVTYQISFWAKKDSNFNGSVTVALEDGTAKVYAKSKAFTLSKAWQHFTCKLTVSGIARTNVSNRFVLYASATGNVYFDVVTVMPPTWKNRPNGVRIDLAEKMAALKLKYIQFPGGCTAESAGMDTSWNWKKSIGPIELRAGSDRNRWGYKNDLYFGLDEYFQLCEDMGATPVYVASSGISETPGIAEWFAISPLDKMQPLIDDVLDLLEYCNGSILTPWGAKRALNGHPAPYHLQYLEIGNENGDATAKEYGPRYVMIRDAVHAGYPGVKILYNGPRDPTAVSHTYGNSVDFTDEHFYMKDLSSLYHKYDSISPECKKICVAEYASSIHGNGGNVVGNFGDALGDAVFMLGCEKNAERIWWTGYGNYGGVIGHSDFGPCIVWNDPVSCFATPSYYMQKMLFSDNQGTRVLPFAQNTLHCFWSASEDTVMGRHDILLKVVNKSNTPEQVRTVLQGVEMVKPVGHATSLKADPSAENTLAYPTRVIPATSTFRASRDFNYVFPANSITVLRIAIQKNSMATP